MVGGQETTTNLIGNGLLTLLRHPERAGTTAPGPVAHPDGGRGAAALREPQPAHGAAGARRHRARRQQIQQRQAVIAVMGAANRDPERFPDPDRLDLTRADNRHVAFGWASHFCFGAPLARIEGQIAFYTAAAPAARARARARRDHLACPTWACAASPRCLSRSAHERSRRGRARVHRRAAAARVPDARQLSAAKRALLEQRLKGRTTVARSAHAVQPVTRREGTGPAPLSAAQEQLWYYSQIAPGNPVYNEARQHPQGRAVRRTTPFARAFNEVVRRHDIWHSTFEIVDGEPARSCASRRPSSCRSST